MIYKKKTIKNFVIDIPIWQFYGQSINVLIDCLNKLQSDFPDYYDFIIEDSVSYDGSFDILGAKLESDEEFIQRVNKLEAAKLRRNSNALKRQTEIERKERKELERLKKKYE